MEPDDNQSVSDDSPRSKTRMTAARYTSAADAGRADADFWRQIPEAERVLEAWRLSLELSQLRGIAFKPGLRRPVVRLQRTN